MATSSLDPEDPVEGAESEFFPLFLSVTYRYVFNLMSKINSQAVNVNRQL